MKSALDLARGLRTKAENDLRTAEIGMEHYDRLTLLLFIFSRRLRSCSRHCLPRAESNIRGLTTWKLCSIWSFLITLTWTLSASAFLD
jgi:hypothetical protein